MVFEAAVKAVQASLKHLSEESIRFPPRNMPDATVASQIALHVVMHRRAATGWLQQRTLHKSVSVYGRARDVIDGRLSEPEFAAVYSKIAADAEDILAAMDAKFEGHDD